MDMLKENEDAISFFPGSVKKGNVSLGRIVVHDRLKVEANVLPRYFNHSSFASLRRQLNYFSFTRLGKGRQRGATYCNEAVIEMDDILRLKRRSAVGPPRTTSSSTTPDSYKRGRSVSLSSSDIESQQRPTKKSRHSVVVTPLPIHHISDGEDQPQITLDLTVPSEGHHYPTPFSSAGDADILAGCKALLSIAKGLNYNGGIGSAN